MAPGEYSIAHGNHSGDYLTNNDAARVEITASQTATVDTVDILRPGGITGTVTGTDGQALSGIEVTGHVTVQNLYWPMPFLPFDINGNPTFSVTTGADGTYTAENLVPGNDWQVAFAVPVTTAVEYTAIAAGGAYSCAVTTDNTINCWGANSFGQTDAPDGQHTAIATGTSHSCAIRTDQTINCWGAEEGEYDLGQTDAPDGQHTAIATGLGHSCAIRTDQTINCWGDNRVGQLDAPDGQHTAIATGGWHSCAIRTDQTINCWGAEDDVYDVDFGQADAPDGQHTAIAANNWHSCAIRTDQTINCWGNNWWGQADAPDGQYTAIATGGWHSCAIRTDQTINCWGNNDNGQTDAPDGQYTAIATGGGHSCAIKADQTINCWGDNGVGQATPSLAAGESTVQGITVVSGQTTTGVDYSTPSEDDADDGDGTDSTDTDDGTDDDTDTDDGTDDSTDTDDGTDDDTDDGAAARCFAHHKFGAEPVDVAKSADKQTVLAQLSWGYHDSIGCYLTLDEAALSALRAAAAPWGFPAGDPEVAQRCSAVHKFGAQPVDVAKTADKQTVLAQVRWGYHDSIGCYLTLDPASIATLRAAHT